MKKAGKEVAAERKKAGKEVAAERKKWQAKGKALPVEKVNQLSQTDYLVEVVKVEVVETATQTEARKEERATQVEERDVIREEKALPHPKRRLMTMPR